MRGLDPALAETLPYILSLLGIAGAGASLAMMDAQDKTPAHAGGGQAHHHP